MPRRLLSGIVIPSKQSASRDLFFILSIFLLGLFQAPFAHAQKKNTDLLIPKAAAPLDMRKIPQEFLDEAMAYNDECAADANMTQYYDCECLSLAYLTERVARGRMASKNELVLAINGQCRDATLSAGPAYQECLRGASLMAEGTDPEKFCRCVANTYVKLINRDQPSIGSNVFVHYKTQATLVCRDPALAKRLYQYVP